ncbi:MAG TPA: phosphatase PAP2 family protein [Gemmatimonadaceae bacterium]|nr:phosphatase PAP2 family protein [Gemmatimonadaceae bacterium]
MRKRWPWLVIFVVAMIGASFIDPWVFHHIQKPNVYDQDWGRALRSVGYWPLWMILSLALWLVDRKGGRGSKRAIFLSGSITAAGIGGEVLKLIIRRERPGTMNGVYAFRAFSDHLFSSRNFGMPSSHAVIAFSGAAAMSILFPEATGVWYALAIGCGVTRVLSGAHFLSDVIAGAAIGIATSIVISRRWGSK